MIQKVTSRSFTAETVMLPNRLPTDPAARAALEQDIKTLVGMWPWDKLELVEDAADPTPNFRVMLDGRQIGAWSEHIINTGDFLGGLNMYAFNRMFQPAPTPPAPATQSEETP